MAVNLTTTYSPLIAERFKAQSFTERYAGRKYKFDGAQSVVVYSVNKATLGDYSRTNSPATGSRFGTVAELGDTAQTLLMSQDKAFTFAIDSGNAADQLNIKQCNEQLKSNWDEVCSPAIDTYRLLQWAKYAGLGVLNGTALTTATVMTAIAVANAALSNAFVPKRNRVLFITESVFVKCKLSTEVLAIPNVAQQSVVNGSVGTIDGTEVVPVPDSIMPAGVNFILKYIDSSVDPMKLKVLRVQKNPLGIDGDVGECRFYHDAFVLDAKVNGIYVHGVSAYLGNLTLSSGGNTPVLACANSTGYKYTTDGSNPKTSSTATTVLSAAYTSSAPTLTSGQTLRAYAYATTGYLNSAIYEQAYA